MTAVIFKGGSFVFYGRPCVITRIEPQSLSDQSSLSSLLLLQKKRDSHNCLIASERLACHTGRTHFLQKNPSSSLWLMKAFLIASRAHTGIQGRGGPNFGYRTFSLLQVTTALSLSALHCLFDRQQLALLQFQLLPLSLSRP